MKPLIFRGLTVLAILTSLGIVGAVSSGPVAGASVSTSASVSSSGSVMPNDGKPNGCPSGYYCSYNIGNGGDLCWTTNASANLSAGCADRNSGGFNNKPNYTANLHYCYNYDCAYYALSSGSYLLYMSTNDFNHCANNSESDKCSGDNFQIGDNLASVYFSN